jgi:putative MFS transporter
MTHATNEEITARLDGLPSSRAVWSIVVVISLGGVFEFYDLFFTAYVAPGMVQSGLFAPASLGIFGALTAVRVAGVGTFVFSTFMGLWIGVIALGQAADRFGRRTIFTASLVWYAVSTMIMALQTRGEWLNIWRFIAGIGFGVQLVTIDTYIVEIVPRALRGRAFAINQCICFSVVPVVAGLAWKLVPLKPFGFDGWRWVVLLGSSGAVAVWALRAGIPESPRWLAAQGRMDEAERIVARLERATVPGGDPLPSRAEREKLPTPLQAVIGVVASAAAAHGGRVRLAEIFAPAYRTRTIMLSVLNAAQVIGFYGFNSWVPTLLIARGINVTHGLGYAFMIAISQPFGPLIGYWFADRIERKFQIVLGLLCMGVLMAVFANANSVTALIATGVAFTLAANVMSYAYHGYQAELFPTRIRSRAVGFVYSWSRLAAAFAGLIIGALLATGGMPAVALFIGGAMILGVSVITLFGPSTNGLALEKLSH